MTVTKIKITKVDKSASPLTQGKIISSNALTLFQQALDELVLSSDILESHANDSLSLADDIMEGAKSQVAQLQYEADEARKGVTYNRAVHDKIAALITP